MPKIINRKIFLKVISVILALWFVLIVSGFFVLPPLLKNLLTSKLSENLNRKVYIEKISFNPVLFTVEVFNFKVSEPNKEAPFFALAKLFIDLELVSVFKKGIVIKEVTLDSPYLYIERISDNNFNFSDLIKNKPTVKEEKEEKKGVFNFSINNIQILNGKLIFNDTPKNKRHEVSDIKLSIPFISNLPHFVENYVTPEFFARINGREFSLKGSTKPFKKSLETSLNIDIKDFNIPYYLTYLPFTPKFLMESCLFSSILSVKYTQYEDKSPTLLVNGKLNISDLVLKTKEKKELLKISGIDLLVGESDIFKKKFHINQVSIQNPQLNILRDEKGEINFKKILPETKNKEVAKKEGTKSDPEITISNINIRGGSVIFSDYFNDVNFKSSVEKIELDINDFKSKGEEPFGLNTRMNINKGGSISVNGNVTLKPLTANLNLDLKGIAIKQFQPYFQGRLNVLVLDGYFNTSGKTILKINKDKAPSVSYSGKLSITNLKTVDSESATDLINWKSLYLEGISVKTDPMDINIENVSLTDFYSRIVINQDGTLNLQKLVVKGEEEDLKNTDKYQDQDKKDDKKANIKISKVTLQNGQINFTDLYIKPNFTANLVELSGRVSGLTSEENKLADVNVMGKLENYAPLEIVGKINPLRDDLFVDLKLDFKNMELSPLTPYSGKYLGYTIEKGKLFLDLKYYIEKKKLSAQNKVFLDQFNLGEKVESPTATKLPVRLAIALLKNRKGEIDLDIPVSGSIDDPEFSVWKIVIKVLVNLLEKAATAPFALLGSLFGSSEELSYIEFDYGLAKLNEKSAKKLDTLIKALYERPALKLEIKGFADAEKDREALRNITYHNKIKTQKLKEILKTSQQPLNVEDIKIEPDEFQKYLKLAYKEEKFPKPKTNLGLEKEIDATEMEKLILTNIVIKEDDLRLLALERVKSVKDYLIKSQKVEPERIFLIDSGSLEPEKKENQSSSRVEFTLK